MQPYNYTIDLPKPPADNFLQNIMGIAQLQGLAQQQEIAKQQAAFQKEMQPYEVQKAQASIAAQQSALAGSEQSRRQNEILFKQAQENRVREMEQQAVAQAKQSELFGRLSALPPDAPISQILPIANELTAYKPEAAKQLMANYENAPKQFQKASETTLVNALNQLNANNIKGAKKTYSTFVSAIEGSMGNNPELRALADAAKVQIAALDVPNEEGVNIAKTSAVQLLSLVNPQAVNAFVGAQETQAKTKKELAEAEEKTWQGALTKWKAQNAMKGELDPDEAIKRENSLRENFLAQPAVRGYQDKIESYDNVKNAEPTTPGDVAKMTAFIKLGDPRSTVSMGESGQLVASNIGEQTAKLVEQFNLNGGKLTDPMRKKIDAQADATMRAAKKSFENGILRGFNETAKRQKINPENVTGFLPPVSIPEKEDQGPTSEEQRIRAMLRPAAGFGNTMTPSQMPPQGSTFQGRLADVDAILKQLGVQ